MPDVNFKDKNGPVDKNKVEDEVLTAREEALTKALDKLKKEFAECKEMYDKAKKSAEEQENKRNLLLEKSANFPKYMLRDLRKADPPGKRTCSLCMRRKPIADFRYTVSEECEECSLLSE